MTTSLGIIGAGNMGEAFIGAVLGTKLFAPSQVWVSDVSEDRLGFISKTYGIQTTRNNGDLFQRCDILILAVKPQQMDMILTEIAPKAGTLLDREKIIISIAAGVRIGKLEAALYESIPAEKRPFLPILRVMPNTPALVLKGVSGLSGNAYASAGHMEAARRILSAMGTVVTFEESDLDAVTALSGSGPAYVFFLAESMQKAGLALGLSEDQSRELTIGTLEGAVALLKRGESPEELRRRVTSPGGTTEAAFKVLEGKDTRTIIIDAIRAAAVRSQELSR